jgi:hypothetical protein
MIGFELQDPLASMGDRQPRQASLLVSGHLDELDAARPHGHQGQAPGQIRVDFALTTKRCDKSRFRDRG